MGKECCDISRFRKMGEERIALVKTLKTREDWETKWKEPKNSYLFEFGTCWKQMIAYYVEDYAAEAGFFCDCLGLIPNGFGDGYAMFTSPNRDFFFAFEVASEENPPTPVGSIVIEFMLADVLKVCRELEERSICFEEKPEPCGEGSPLHRAAFRTPNGHKVRLWGMVEENE